MRDSIKKNYNSNVINLNKTILLIISIEKYVQLHVYITEK